MGIFIQYVYAILRVRLFLRLIPLREREISEESGQEFVYQVYLAFSSASVLPVMRSRFDGRSP